MSRFRLLFGLLLLLAGFTACRPKNVLSRSEMADVLFDLHLAESINEVAPAHTNWFKGMDYSDFSDMAYQSVLRKHKITEKDFFASVSYYSKNLRLYSKIYNDLDKRYQELLDKNTFVYVVPTLKECLAHLTLDTVKVKEWFNFGAFKPDTLPAKQLFPPSRSIISYGAWFASQYMTPVKKDKKVFRVVPLHFTPLKVDSVASGSKAFKDTLLNGKPLSVDTIGNHLVISRRGPDGSIKKEIVARAGGRKIPNVHVRTADSRIPDPNHRILQQ